jgi:hypothetical protein
MSLVAGYLNRNIERILPELRIQVDLTMSEGWLLVAESGSWTARLLRSRY